MRVRALEEPGHKKTARLDVVGERASARHQLDGVDPSGATPDD
jgi:hypothetical protein